MWTNYIEISYISPDVVVTRSTADEEVPDAQVSIIDNWEQQEFADNNNLIIIIDDEVAAECPAIKLIKCPHCIYQSNKNWRVTRHIKTQHTHKDKNPFKCGKCGLTTKRKSVLIRHEKTCKE